MKNSIYYIIALLIILSGCRKDLLDTTPYDSLGENQFWKNEKHALSAVTGVYQNLQREYVYRDYYRRDGLTPIVYSERTNFMAPFTAGTISSESNLFEDTWEEFYRGIQRANVVLARLPEIPEIDDNVRSRLIGETKFLRALHYFNLWNVFGGVPIYDVPVTIAESYKPRNTAEEVLQFILKDLNDAIEILPEKIPDSEHGRATKGAAIALRGKVYLYDKQWSKAESDFKAVMDMDIYKLHPEYTNLFSEENETSPEFIFSVQFAEEPNLGNEIQYRLGTRTHAPGNNTFNLRPTNILVDSYENLDGSPFDWDAIIPGFSTMSIEEKDVILLRDDITDKERETILSTQALKDLYIEGGNENRIKKAYVNRDARLQATVIVPYATINGYLNNNYTLRSPFRNVGAPEYDLGAGGANTPTAYAWNKFVVQGDDLADRTWGPIDFPVLRYADILLMFAEARNENTGPDMQVFDAVNAVRTRAGLPNLQNSDPLLPTFVGNKDDMWERIRKERSVEFVLEGNYYNDVRRWNIGSQVNNHDIQYFNGAHLNSRRWLDHYNLWAIPLFEIDNNPNLTQNPGW